MKLMCQLPCLSAIIQIVAPPRYGVEYARTLPNMFLFKPSLGRIILLRLAYAFFHYYHWMQLMRTNESRKGLQMSPGRVDKNTLFLVRISNDLSCLLYRYTNMAFFIAIIIVIIVNIVLGHLMSPFLFYQRSSGRFLLDYILAVDFYEIIV